MRILVLGASGMLGNAMIRVLSERQDWEVYGTLRSQNHKGYFSSEIAGRLLSGVDVEQHDSLLQAFIRVRPDWVINCVGLVKQLADAENPLQVIPINAILPHRIARLCELVGAKLVHMSTDCVFSGERGGYCESDTPDAKDLYGRSKLLGEVNYPHTVTLRTSIIGHELQSAHGLVSWFLSQRTQCYGYRKVIFSGLPTIVLAQIIRDHVISNSNLSGVYHVASQPISKYDLLLQMRDAYGLTIEIIPDDKITLDRSLKAELFQKVTGYVAPDWHQLIKLMHSSQ